jgi:hypothetical protein
MVERGVGAVGPDDDLIESAGAPPDPPAAPRPSLRPSAYGLLLLAAVSIQPFAGFVAENPQEELPLVEMAAYAVVVFLLAVATWLAVSWIRRERPHDTTALVVAVVVFAFFHANLILNPYPRGMVRWVQPVVWLLVAALLVVLVVRLATAPAVRTFALVLFGVWALISLGVAVSVTLDASSEGAELVDQADIEFVPAAGATPNVYWFVFDEYARNDQLERFAGLDNSAMYDELEARGFQVSESSMTSYARTHLSMSSTLAMTYPVTEGTELDYEFRALSPVFAGDNVTVDRFREHGYQYLFADQAMLPWASCREDLADHCLPAASGGLDDVQIGLLKLTPIGGFPFDQPHTDPVQIVESIEDLGDEVQEPFFLFAHVNAPHFPYRYGPDCEFRTEPIASAPLDVAQWAAYYRQEIACLNELILDGVDRIIADDPDAIIILQSDHGSASTVDWSAHPDEWSAETLQERFSVLNAMRLPPECNERFDLEGEPLVNTFRIVFSCIEGTDIELLDQRAFMAPWGDIGAMEEVDPGRFDEP